MRSSYICCLQETHFKHKDAHRLKLKAGAGYAMPTLIKRKQQLRISDKADLRTKKVISDKEKHYITMKRLFSKRT